MDSDLILLVCIIGAGMWKESTIDWHSFLFVKVDTVVWQNINLSDKIWHCSY